jgi:hypothetical protein
MVMSAQGGTRETLENDAESTGCDVEVARLEPDTVGIRNPATAVFCIDAGNKVFAAPSTRIETVVETVEVSNRQCSLLC